MKKLTIVALILCFLAGCLFASVVAEAQNGSIAPGVYASTFPNGTVCYTNNAGGIFCVK